MKNQKNENSVEIFYRSPPITNISAEILEILFPGRTYGLLDISSNILHSLSIIFEIGRHVFGFNFFVHNFSNKLK